MEQAQALFLVDVKNCFIHRESGAGALQIKEEACLQLDIFLAHS